MQKIIKYAIAGSNESCKNLEDKVNALIDDGWQPLGGFQYWSCENGRVRAYFQAMVKYSEEIGE